MTSDSQQMFYQKNILIFRTHEEVGNHYEKSSFQQSIHLHERVFSHF